MHSSIRKCFEPMIGQVRPIIIAETSVNSYANGGNLPSFFIQGLAGLGKTMFLHCILNALNIAYAIRTQAKAACNQSLFYSSPDEFRRAGDEFGTLQNALSDMRPLFLAIDEAQDFGQRKTVQTERVFKFIKKALDANGWERGVKHVRFDGDNVYSITKDTFCSFSATNFPEKVPDAAAWKGRHQVVELGIMNQDELTSILMLMLKARAITANEKTISRIAACGRGTCRPLEKIVDSLETRIQADKKSTRSVNCDDALSCMRVLQLFPRGLEKHEVSMLAKCQASPAGYRTASLSLMLNKEEKSIRQSIAYLQGCDFLGLRGSYAVIAPKGLKYLQKLTEDKFLSADKDGKFIVKE